MASIDWDQIEKEIQRGATGNGKPMIGTSAGRLAGVDIMDAAVNRSPCAQLKWLNDNTPFKLEAFVTLTFDSGYQGIRVMKKSNGSVVRTIQFPITGGDDADPYRQIPINHRRMVRRLLAIVAERLAAGDEP